MTTTGDKCPLWMRQCIRLAYYNEPQSFEIEDAKPWTWGRLVLRHPAVFETWDAFATGQVSSEKEYASFLGVRLESARSRMRRIGSAIGTVYEAGNHLQYMRNAEEIARLHAESARLLRELDAIRARLQALGCGPRTQLQETLGLRA